ncbi:hypothetical protein D6779_08015 [Candidatus Parcubacteria bacterium]|nr:MAG: hypothetical protein D6779_08015 [Candidatus Parcubacteria bacterium]
MARAIVVQRFPKVLREIQRAVSLVNQDANEKIFYTADPDEAAELARDEEEVVVVSSQVFSPDVSGTTLASKIKRENPRALFFLYSYTPEHAPQIDGIIPKTPTHHLLAEFLSFVVGSDFQATQLQSRFPQIEFSSDK